jgi:sarcosine oxidase subunit delta
VKQRPSPDASERDWSQYIFMQNNKAGEQTEWWFHRAGCRQWLHALRNTVTNEVIRAYFPDQERP